MRYLGEEEDQQVHFRRKKRQLADQDGREEACAAEAHFGNRWAESPCAGVVVP